MIPWTLRRRRTVILCSVFLAALAVRLPPLAYTGFAGDIYSFKHWAMLSHFAGVTNVYEATWGENYLCNYPPLALYGFWVLGETYLLVHPRPDDSALFTVVIKLPSILADLGIGLVLFLFLQRRIEFKRACAGAALFLFNPAVWFVSSVWGQNDSWFALLVAAGLLLLPMGYWRSAFVMAGLAGLVKPHAWLVLLPMMLLSWKQYGRRKALGGLLLAMLAVLALIAPYVITGNLTPMYRNVSFMLNWFPHVTSNAYNPWFLVDRLPLPLPRDEGRIIDRVPLIGPISFRHVGLVLWVLWALWTGRRIYREPGEQSYLVLSFLLFFGFYMLPTEVHARYVYPAFIPLCAALALGQKLGWIYVGLSLCFFANVALCYWENSQATSPAWVAVSGSAVALGYLALFASCLWMFRKPDGERAVTHDKTETG